MIEALERLALSVLSQVVDALVPDHQPPASQQTREEAPTSAWQQVKIVLAKRGGTDGFGLLVDTFSTSLKLTRLSSHPVAPRARRSVLCSLVAMVTAGTCGWVGASSASSSGLGTRLALTFGVWASCAAQGHRASP